MRGDDGEWFDGVRGRDDGEWRFLAVLCAQADGWRLAGLSPADTDGIARSLVPLVLVVDTRPVERLDWMMGKTLVVRRLRLADTGGVISRKGAGWWTPSGATPRR